MDEFLEQALAMAERLIAENPDYAPSEQPPPYQGVTNRVVRAQYRGRPAIIKVFRRAERWQRELYGLQHFAPTGLVPCVIDGSRENLVVMAELPYTDLPLRALGAEPAGLDASRAGRSLGEAAARLTTVPLSAEAAAAFEGRFYDGLNLEGYLMGIVGAAHRVQAACALYQRPIFQESLAFLDAQAPVLLRQPRILYHQDAGNVCFLGDRVSGFFDLEMCRVGTLSMQVGSLFVIFQWTPLRWRDCLQGLAVGLGRPLDPSEIAASLAFAHFMIWRYVTRYGEWDGQFTSQEEAEQEVGDAIDYATSLGCYNAIVQEAGMRLA